MASGAAYINEIYFDPPHSGGDVNQEYIELRGTPGMSLDNHYLLLLENENSSLDNGSAGEIEFMVDLTGRSFGSNGFLTLRQKGSPYTHIAPGTTDLINTGTGVGWGTGPADNNIGVSSNSSDPGKIENSGFTAMLIDKGTGAVPTLGLALDGMVDNDNDPMTVHDGLDYATGQPGWSILDSVGIFSEIKEVEFGRTYAPINFGPELDGQVVSFVEQSTGLTFQNFTVHPHLVEGQTYVGVGAELEHIARYGDSTGSTEHDWVVSNLTDEASDGWISADNGFLQSGSDPHGLPRDQPSGTVYTGISFPKGYLPAESSQYVPYGTNMTNTLGAANYPLNQSVLPWDYNHDGVVDAADYTVWRDSLGQTDPAGIGIPGNPNRSGSIDQADYAIWKYHFGETLPGAASAGLGFNVPEPTSFLLVMAGLTASAGIRRRVVRLSSK
jgi:PEP-CTERM motif